VLLKYEIGWSSVPIEWMVFLFKGPEMEYADGLSKFGKTAASLLHQWTAWLEEERVGPLRRGEGLCQVIVACRAARLEGKMPPNDVPGRQLVDSLRRNQASLVSSTTQQCWKFLCNHESANALALFTVASILALSAHEM